MIDRYYKILYDINNVGFKSQRALAASTDLSVGSVNLTLKQLEEEGYILRTDEKITLTANGSRYLEASLEVRQDRRLQLDSQSELLIPIKSAVILAAGANKHFNEPVGLLQIDGISIVERIIRQLNASGIEKIYIVVGYKSEKYKEALSKYKDIIFIENDRFKWTGTMASLAAAAPYLNEDFLLIDGNQIFEETAITDILNAESRSCLLLTNPSDSGDAAFVELEEDGTIFRISKDIRQMNSVDAELVGISKISLTLWEKMLSYFENNRNPKLNYEYVVENIGRLYHINGLMKDNMAWSVIENEVLYTKAENLIFPIIRRREQMRKENTAKKTLMDCMNLEETEIEVCKLGGGMTNTNYFVRFNGKDYVLRIAGAGTDVMINRHSEQYNSIIASKMGFNPETIYFDADTGIKITECIKGAETLNAATARLEENIKKTTTILRTLHNSDIELFGEFSVKIEYEKYKKRIENAGGKYYKNTMEMDTFFYKILARLNEIGLNIKPCHNDLVAENLIKDSSGRMYLIDWEYSGYNDPMWDLAAHLIECEFSEDDEELFLYHYFNETPDEKSIEKIMIFKMCQDILWSTWTILKETEGEDFGSYGVDRLNRAMAMSKQYIQKYGKELE
jgi:Predicted choline kinase involved in LPS biosynthesis